MKRERTHILIASLLLAAAIMGGTPVAARQQDANEAKDAADAFAAKLNDRNPVVRLRSAEELARRAAVGQRKLIEGYRLQEKDARVRLALDWALYRTGKNEALFAVVKDLDSSRASQAAGYLQQIEGPRPLYIFLDAVNGKTKIKLLEVLGRIGDDETRARLNAYTTAPDPKIAAAARDALKEMDTREARAAATNTTTESDMRPRKSKVKTNDTP